MDKKYDSNIRLAQSASALGAGLLGFGLGAMWGFVINSAAIFLVLAIGAILHIAGMYVVQMKNHQYAGLAARVLWISAWVCLISLIAILVYITAN